MNKETAKLIAKAMLENVTKELQEEHLRISVIVAQACNNELPDKIKDLLGTKEEKEYLRKETYVYLDSYKHFYFSKGDNKIYPFVITDKSGRTVNIPPKSNALQLVRDYEQKSEKLKEQHIILAAIIFKLKTEKRILEHFPESADVISKFFPAKNTDVLVINDDLKKLVKCSIEVKKGCEILRNCKDVGLK